MTSRIATIAIDAVDPEAVAAFWCDVLGWRVLEREDDLVSVGPGDASWPTIDVAAVPEGKVVKNRLHLDLRADDTTTQAELDRLLALGARRVDVGQGRTLRGSCSRTSRATSSACCRGPGRKHGPRTPRAEVAPRRSVVERVPADGAAAALVVEHEVPETLRDALALPVALTRFPTAASRPRRRPSR